MNINLKAKRILCYGDSNTWGDPPQEEATRYPLNVRWTGVLQKNLGDDYEIIEEGLCGRTTVLDDPKDPNRNGKSYLPACLQTHKPLNLVILMLGTNDLKTRFNLSAENIAGNIGQLVEIIQNIDYKIDGPAPKILIISPAHVKEKVKSPIDGMDGASQKSKELAKHYEKVAKKKECEFLDIAEYVESSNIDGAHFEKNAHAKMAEVLANKIKNILA